MAAALPAPFAGFLVETGLPAEALDELERAALACPECPVADAPYLAAGEALAARGDHVAAARAFTEAVERCADPSVREEREAALAGFELAAGEAGAAARRLAKVERFTEREDVRRRAGRLLCAARALDGTTPGPEDWPGAPLPEAAGALARATPARDAVLGGLASAILPGLGQLMGGDPAAAGGALAANAVWIGWTLSLSASPLDAGLVAFTFGWRYYTGNIRRGAETMRARAERKRHEAAAHLLQAALAE